MSLRPWVALKRISPSSAFGLRPYRSAGEAGSTRSTSRGTTAFSSRSSSTPSQGARAARRTPPRPCGPDRRDLRPAGRKGSCLPAIRTDIATRATHRKRGPGPAVPPDDLSTREIADELYLSVHTIKTHVKHLYAKLDERTPTTPLPLLTVPRLVLCFGTSRSLRCGARASRSDTLQLDDRQRLHGHGYLRQGDASSPRPAGPFGATR
jgi:hypothetical protein